MGGLEMRNWYQMLRIWQRPAAHFMGQKLAGCGAQQRYLETIPVK